MSFEMRAPDFFIVGLQKSGTYGLSALLDAHPEIRCLPNHPIHNYTKGKTGADEGRIFDLLANVDQDGGEALKNSFLNHHGGFFKDVAVLIGRVSKEEMYRVVKKRYQEWFQFHNSENKPIVGDKTTEYVFHLAMIDDFFPNAKKICIIRDPKDRIVSWNFHQIRKGRKQEKEISGGFVRDYVENRIRKEYESLLAYGGFIHCLTYESLKKEPRKVLPSVLSYLGAESLGKITDKMLKEASFKNLREKEILYLRGIGEEPAIKHYRRGIVGEWKDYLSPEQVGLIDELIGSLEKRVFKKCQLVL